MSTFSAAAQHIKHYHSSSKEKDVQSMKYKFTQMKLVYLMIKEWLEHVSGVHYDNINGADICDEVSAKVFDEWISQKGYEKMKPFYNKGWRYYGLMQENFPEGGATGNATFCDTVGAPSISHTTQSTPSHAGHASEQITGIGVGNITNTSSCGATYYPFAESQ
ncbi:hypothetical protein HD554DRAFT_2037468 [Boletus coccyginus]|nr:hypothetical protein HD554DRAFT_2037468 [Boletus coccyginus]